MNNLGLTYIDGGTIKAERTLTPDVRGISHAINEPLEIHPAVRRECTHNTLGGSHGLLRTLGRNHGGSRHNLFSTGQTLCLVGEEE